MATATAAVFVVRGRSAGPPFVPCSRATGRTGYPGRSGAQTTRLGPQIAQNVWRGRADKRFAGAARQVRRRKLEALLYR